MLVWQQSIPVATAVWFGDCCLMIHLPPSLSPSDSPGIPVSATSREVFRGFSYVDPTLLDEERRISLGQTQPSSTIHMSTVSQDNGIVIIIIQPLMNDQ